MKILLIEDDREAASYLIQALDEAGHVTHHATDGETGYAMASSMDYDVLIVDRMLPRRDGLSIVEALRAEGNKTPVLILRSEEHTSELQSHVNLVCRLLLEKKK